MAIHKSHIRTSIVSQATHKVVGCNLCINNDIAVVADSCTSVVVVGCDTAGTVESVTNLTTNRYISMVDNVSR